MKIIFALAACGWLLAGCTTAPADARKDATVRLAGKGAAGAPIVYFEVAGPDAARLKSFYTAAFGWNINAAATIDAASTGGLRGGIRQDPPEKIFYLGVPDIVAALKQIEAAGGKTIVPRTVVPGVVTFALFTDPAGNRMGLAEFGSYPH
jgi:hypothetical protein